MGMTLGEADRTGLPQGPLLTPGRGKRCLGYQGMLLYVRWVHSQVEAGPVCRGKMLGSHEGLELVPHLGCDCDLVEAHRVVADSLAYLAS